MTFASEVEADELAERRAAVDAIAKLAGIRQGKHAFEREEKEVRVALDNWFLTHPGELELHDDERGFVASLRSGGTQEYWEAAAIVAEKAPELFSRLLALGCVTIDAAAVRRERAAGRLGQQDVGPWIREGERSPTLQVKRIGQ